MSSLPPEPHPAWTIEQLVDALNRMRDAWTSAALELRDVQFDLDTAQRKDAIERVNDIVKRINSH